MAQDSGLNGGCHGDRVNRSESIDWPSISSRRQATGIENEEFSVCVCVCGVGDYLCVHVGVCSYCTCACE